MGDKSRGRGEGEERRQGLLKERQALSKSIIPSSCSTASLEKQGEQDQAQIPPCVGPSTSCSPRYEHTWSGISSSKGKTDCKITPNLLVSQLRSPPSCHTPLRHLSTAKGQSQ